MTGLTALESTVKAGIITGNSVLESTLESDYYANQAPANIKRRHVMLHYSSERYFRREFSPMCYTKFTLGHRMHHRENDQSENRKYSALRH